MNVIELFAGAAGLAQGFERSGHYKTLALYDIENCAKRTYLENYPNAKYLTQDISRLKREDVYEALGTDPLHGILGGPPCQGFSLAGKRNTDSELNQLVMAYANVVLELCPDFLVMENVPQLLFHPIFERLIKRLSQDYYLIYGILNAARYGTPQTRHRLFMVAYKKAYGIKPTFPQPTHGKYGQRLYAYHLNDSSKRVTLTGKTEEAVFGADPVVRDRILEQVNKVDSSIGKTLLPLVKVGDAISDLVQSVAKEGHFAPYSTPPQSEYQRQLRNESATVANCVARRHQGSPLRIVETLAEGGTPSIGIERGKHYYSQAYSRLHRAGLARTLTTSFQNAGSGRFFHYNQPRTLTIREAARLQGFADSFVFCGSLAQQMQLVGNAVPLPLAEAIGRHIAKELGQLYVNDCLHLDLEAEVLDVH